MLIITNYEKYILVYHYIIILTVLFSQHLFSYKLKIKKLINYQF